MKLYFFHGRDTINDQPSDWGYTGPTLYGVAWMSTTYMTTIRFGFETHDAYNLAKSITGWDSWDDLVLEMRHHDDLVEVGGKLYGDWDLDAA